LHTWQRSVACCIALQTRPRSVARCIALHTRPRSVAARCIACSTWPRSVAHCIALHMRPRSVERCIALQSWPRSVARCIALQSPPSQATSRTDPTKHKSLPSAGATASHRQVEPPAEPSQQNTSKSPPSGATSRTQATTSRATERYLKEFVNKGEEELVHRGVLEEPHTMKANNKQQGQPYNQHTAEQTSKQVMETTTTPSNQHGRSHGDVPERFILV
jgi:hypothetical protein